MYKNRNIYSLFLVQVLMIIYTAYFAAQVFSINNDTGANIGTTTYLISAKDNKTTAKSHQHKQQPGRQRLNKRFQPEDWVFIPPAPVAVYSRFVPPVNKPLFFYRNGFVPSFLFIAQTLRGPPVTA